MKARKNVETHPIEDGRPPLHGDALEDRQHGEPDIIEGRDAVVGALPPLQTHGIPVPAPVAALALGLRLVVRVARHLFVPLLDDLI